MRNLILPLLATLLFVASCKKESKPADTTINPGNANAVAASITVVNGEKITGTMPVTNNSTGSPVLQDWGTAVTLKTIADKYAIFSPYLISGSLIGYYVQVKGTNSYFKVDNTIESPAKDVVAIHLPATIGTGIFSIMFSVYDSLNRISKAVELSISVEKLGGAGSDFLTGTWKLSGYKRAGVNWYDSNVYTWDYDVYAVKPNHKYSINCIYNKLEGMHGSADTHPTVYTELNQTQCLKDNMVFNKNSTGSRDYADQAFAVDYGLSTCSNVMFIREPQTDRQWMENYGVLYDGAGKKLRLLYGYEYNATPGEKNYGTGYYDYDITQSSPTKIIIKGDDEKEYTKQ